MAKEATGQLKLQVKGGAANPSPPVDLALGAKDINIIKFCKQFNIETQDRAGKVLPATVTYYVDKSLDFIVKTPPVAIQLLEASKAKDGSAESNRVKVAKVTWDQVRTIAEDKMFDPNCLTVESATKMVAGTTRSTGISVTDTKPESL